MTMEEFCDQLARLRFIDRDDLPATPDWDDDWPSFRADPYQYMRLCSDEHRKDIWQALEHDRTNAARARERGNRVLTAIIAQLSGER